MRANIVFKTVVFLCRLPLNNDDTDYFDDYIVPYFKDCSGFYQFLVVFIFIFSLVLGGIVKQRYRVLSPKRDRWSLLELGVGSWNLKGSTGIPVPFYVALCILHMIQRSFVSFPRHTMYLQNKENFQDECTKLLVGTCYNPI